MLNDLTARGRRLERSDGPPLNESAAQRRVSVTVLHMPAPIPYAGVGKHADAAASVLHLAFSPLGKTCFHAHRGPPMASSFSRAIALGISVVAAGACSVSDGCTTVTERTTLAPLPSPATGALASKAGDSRTLLGDPGSSERASGVRSLVWDGAGANPFDNLGVGSSAVSGASKLVALVLSSGGERKRLTSRPRSAPSAHAARVQRVPPGLVL